MIYDHIRFRLTGGSEKGDEKSSDAVPETLRARQVGRMLRLDDRRRQDDGYGVVQDGLAKNLG